jgi:hypothetical protein
LFYYTTFINVGGVPTPVNNTILNAKGKFGWCGFYDYPYDAGNGFIYGDANHSLFITFPLPWCVSAASFAGHLKQRVDAWSPMGVMYDVRPLGSYNLSNTCGAHYDTVNLTPRNFSLYDTGGFYRSAVTLNFDDSYNPQFVSSFDSTVSFEIIGINATLQDPPAASDLRNGSLIWWSTMTNCPFTPYNPNATNTTYSTCDVCKSECDAGFFQIDCTTTPRKAPIDNFGITVQMACRDPTWGFLWRVTNPSNANLHMDWLLFRPGFSLGQVTAMPGQALPIDVFLPPSSSPEAMRMPYWCNVSGYGDALQGMPLWPGQTAKHISASQTYFYLPAFKDLNTSHTGPTFPNGVNRAVTIDLYAGRPHYYQSNTILDAFIAFFNASGIFQLDTLYSLNIISNVTSKANAVFPGDEVRQGIIQACQFPVRAAVEAVLNVPDFPFSLYCATLLTGEIEWLTFVNFTSTLFFPTFNGTAVDPAPNCTCDQTLTSPCGLAITSPSVKPNIAYDYNNVPPTAPVQVSIQPVCRMGPNLPVANLAPPPAFDGVPGHMITTYLATDTINRLIPPMNITQSLLFQSNQTYLTLTTYSDAPFGVLWRINNNDPKKTDAPIRVRWEIGEYVPPSGTTAGQVIPVPFRKGSGTDITMSPSTTYWLFSRTNSSHKLYGTAGVPCTSVTNCDSVLPTDPANLGYGASRVFDVAISNVTVLSLPLCECFVNAPCNISREFNGTSQALWFLFNTPNDVNVSGLVSVLAPPPSPTPTPPPPPPGPPTAVLLGSCIPFPVPPPPPPGSYTVGGYCVPYPEICNGIDDNCDGYIDNIPDLGCPCTSFYAGGPCLASPGFIFCDNTTNLTYCKGQAQPEIEFCTSIDEDCDGVPCKPIGVGNPCGSNVGRCKQGTLACRDCTGTYPIPICNNSIDPIPEICGNGIDDDCNGLIDDGCLPPGAPGGPPPNEWVPPLPPVGSPAPLPPLPPPPPLPSNLLGWAELGLDKIGIDLAGFKYNLLAPFLLGVIIIFICVTTCIGQTRNNTRRMYSPAPSNNGDGGGGGTATAPVPSSSKATAFSSGRLPAGVAVRRTAAAASGDDTGRIAAKKEYPGGGGGGGGGGGSRKRKPQGRRHQKKSDAGSVELESVETHS